MSTALHFTVPESLSTVSEKANDVMQQVGVPIRTDSGHYLTGVIQAYARNVEMRVSWLPATEGTQVTVTASDEELDDDMLLRVAERYRNAYCHSSEVKRSTRMGTGTVNAIAILVSAIAVMVVFLFILLHH